MHQLETYYADGNGKLYAEGGKIDVEVCKTCLTKIKHVMDNMEKGRVTR